MPLYSDLPYIGPPRWYGNWRTGKDLIVVHCTANTASAGGEAGYARRREDKVSSHYYVDDESLVQSLNTDLVAWHAGNDEGNTRGISYEFTGLATWSRSTWLADSDDIHLAARQMARDAAHWDIPVRWLTVDQLRAGWAGLTTHDDVRRAWGGTHTDPGPGFPKDVLLAEVKRAMTGGDMEQSEPVPITQWTKDKWGLNGLTVGRALADGYTYSRAALEHAVAARLRDEAILAAVSGLDTEAVLTRINELAAAEAARDAELRDLLEQHSSGQLDAAEVVRRMGELLTGAEPAPQA